MYSTSLKRIEQQLKNLKHKVTCGVQFFDTFADFPDVGKECAVYVDKETGTFYVWNGLTYVSCCTEGGAGVQGVQGLTGPQGVQGVQGLNGSVGLAYGSFWSTDDQTATGSEDQMAMSVNNSGAVSGITLLGGPPQDAFRLINAGVYNIQFSAQLYRAAGGSDAHVAIWLKKNGNHIPQSATYVHFNSNNTYIVAAWNFFVSANALDEFQLFWSTDDINISLETLAEDAIIAGVPSVPSVIITINQIA